MSKNKNLIVVGITTLLIAWIPVAKMIYNYETVINAQEKEIQTLEDKVFDENGTEYKLKFHSMQEEYNDLYERTKWKNLGVFKITYYCDCELCQGSYIGTTATGNKPAINRTIAVDPNVIALGTKVKINGIEYIAEDTGEAINNKIIDIYVDNHSEAISKGVIYTEVYIYLI